MDKRLQNHINEKIEQLEQALANVTDPSMRLLLDGYRTAYKDVLSYADILEANDNWLSGATNVTHQVCQVPAGALKKPVVERSHNLLLRGFHPNQIRLRLVKNLFPPAHIEG